MLARLKARHARRKAVWAAGIIAVIAVGILVGVLALTGVIGGPGPGPTAIAQFPPRPFTLDDFWPGERRILHVRPGPAGEAEMWFDPRRGRARWELRDADGSLRLLAVVDGQLYSEYDSTYPWLEIRKEQRDWAWNRWLALHGWYVAYHGWIRQGIVKPAEATWRGRPALMLEVPVIGEDGQVEEVRSVYLDRATQLPVGSIAEWLPVEMVDPALFRLPDQLPPVRVTDRVVQLTRDEARAFNRFDIYHAGASFQGRPLLLVYEVEKVYGADWSDPSQWPPTHYVEAVYGRPGPLGLPGEERLSITSSPDDLVQAPWEENPPMPRPGSPGRAVTVAGVEGLLFEVPDGTMLWLQLGTTVISISGENAEQVLAAADALQKLN